MYEWGKTKNMCPWQFNSFFWWRFFTVFILQVIFLTQTISFTKRSLKRTSYTYTTQPLLSVIPSKKIITGYSKLSKVALLRWSKHCKYVMYMQNSQVLWKINWKRLPLECEHNFFALRRKRHEKYLGCPCPTCP